MTRDGSTSLTLLQRIRSGDTSGWRHVLDLYTPLVYYWCNRWGVPATDAEDVVQEVFQAASQGISTFRREGEGDTFRGWLRGITHHKVLALRRADSRRPDPLGGTDALQMFQEIPGPDAAVDEEEVTQTAALFHRALGLLRAEFEERTWQAFWRTAVDGQPAPSVAGELSMTPNAVRMAKSRVLRRLREELGDLVE
jgi:RNA polymerase sigma-70 factor (ECF subfamily)